MEESEINKLLRVQRGQPKKSTGRCLDESELAAYVARSLGDRDTKTAEAHLVSCDDCLSQVAFLMKSAEWPHAADVPASLYHSARNLVVRKPGVSWFSWDWRWATAAAAACFVLVFVVVVLQQRRQSPDSRPDDRFVALQASPAPVVPPSIDSPLPSPRENSNRVQTSKATPDQIPTVRSTTPAEPLPTLITPRAGSVLRRDELEFRWEAVPDAVFYEVQIMTSSGDLVFEGQTEDTKLKPGTTASLQPGTKYFVVTRAQLRQGKASKSSVVSFRLAE